MGKTNKKGTEGNKPFYPRTLPSAALHHPSHICSYILADGVTFGVLPGPHIQPTAID